MKRTIRPSKKGYGMSVLFLMLYAFSFPVLIGASRYFNSDFFFTHTLSICMLSFWFFYLYQEIELCDDKIIKRNIGLKGFCTETYLIENISKWDNENPLVLHKNNGSKAEIRWAVYSEHDKNVILIFLRENIGEGSS